MNKALIVVIPVVVAALVFSGITMVRLQEANAKQIQLSDKLAATEQNAQELDAKLNDLRQKLGETQLAAAEAEATAREKITALEAKLVAADRQLADASEDDWDELGADDTTTAAAGKKEDKGFGAILKNMMKNDDMKKMMRQSQMAMLDRTYGHLFAKLDLPEDKLKQLKELLVERQMAGAERGMDFLTIGKDKEKMAALVEEIKLEQEAVDEEMKALLSAEEYAQVKGYEETIGERMQVSQFAGAAQAAGEPLSEEQTESLITLMHDTNRDVFGDGFNHNDKTEAMRAMQTEEGITGMLDKMDQANEQLIRDSGNVLTPGQQDAFAKHQKQQAQMQKVGIQMMQSMMAGDKEE